MGKKKHKKKKKHFSKFNHTHSHQNDLQQPSRETMVNDNTKQPDTTPKIDLSKDADATAPKKKVTSDVRKIAILATCLAAVVIFVAILDAQTNLVNEAGEKLMNLLNF